MSLGAAPGAPSASAWRRYASLLYEVLVVIAIVFLAALLFPGAATARLGVVSRAALAIYLASILGAYFTIAWSRGQTLAMRAWHLRIVDANGAAPRPVRAAARFVIAAVLLFPLVAAALWLREHRESQLAWLVSLPGLIALAWPLLDRDRRTLYDIAAGTWIIVATKQ